MKVAIKETAFTRKTLWDWLQFLMTVAIPLAGVFVGAQLNNDRTIALDQQRQVVLETYLDRMSELVVMKQLSQSKPGDEVRSVAQARTLAALAELDQERKGALLKFLAQTQLISRKQMIISLEGADLTAADLNRANLSGTYLNAVDLSRATLSPANLTDVYLLGATLSDANLSHAVLSRTILSAAKLSGANLSGATLLGVNLTDADLSRADLSRAILSGANLSAADLSGANLHGAIVSLAQLAKARSLTGTTMPNGSIHP